MRIVAIIQARMGSTRFPGKVMADLCGKPVLQHVVERVQEAKGIDEVVIACPGDGYDMARKLYEAGCDNIPDGVRIDFPDVPEDDVLARFVTVAKDTNADWVIRVCGDNPLIDPRGIEELVEATKQYPTTDYLSHYVEGHFAIACPTGYFAELVSCRALERLDNNLSPDNPQREHVTQGMYENREHFDCGFLGNPDWYTPGVTPNASIDTPEDLERVRAIMEAKEVTV